MSLSSPKLVHLAKTSKPPLPKQDTSTLQGDSTTTATASGGEDKKHAIGSLGSKDDKLTTQVLYILLLSFGRMKVYIFVHFLL